MATAKQILPSTTLIHYTTMSDLTKFQVHPNCISCGRCFEHAPENFEADTDRGAGRSFVCKQPETEDEVEACLEAIDLCPVEAIEEL